jgi:hypothetical protein
MRMREEIRTRMRRVWRCEDEQQRSRHRLARGTRVGTGQARASGTARLGDNGAWREDRGSEIVTL